VKFSSANILELVVVSLRQRKRPIVFSFSMTSPLLSSWRLSATRKLKCNWTKSMKRTRTLDKSKREHEKTFLRWEIGIA